MSGDVGGLNAELVPIALLRRHFPNYVTEGVFDLDPARSTQRTRVKCDGEPCDFYAEDPSWFVARDRHVEHLGEVLVAALREEWDATDTISIELEQWPSGARVHASREAAEATFVHDGEDVLVHRLVSDWQVYRPASTPTTTPATEPAGLPDEESV